MKKVLRFFEMFLAGILLVCFVLMLSLSNLILKKDTLKKELDDFEVYAEVNKEIKNGVKEEFGKEFNNYPELRNKFNDMVNYVFNEETLRKITDNLLDQVFELKNIKDLDLQIIVKEYRSNIDNYLEKEKIKLPTSISNHIDDVFNIEEIEKITDENFYIFPYIRDYRDIVKTLVYLPLIVAVIIMGLALIISKEKFKVIYKPLLFSGIILLILNLFSNFVLRYFDYNSASLRVVIMTIRDKLFNTIDCFTIGFLIIGTGLVITETIIDKKKDNE